MFDSTAKQTTTTTSTTMTTSTTKSTTTINNKKHTIINNKTKQTNNKTTNDTMPLLGQDHLSRGQGPIQKFNQIFYTSADITVIVLNTLLLYTSLGPTVASYFCSGDDGDNDDDNDGGCLTEPLGTARPLQAALLLNGILIYFVKVLYWNWIFSHSNTISVSTVLLVGFGYYYFLTFSIMVPTYVVNRMPSPVEIALAVIVEPLTLLHELLADRELTEFKATKKKGELLDYGYHSACRHPNYFFNFFPIGCIGLMSGSKLVGLMWVGIQIFWAYTQSGPGLEAYMAENYREKWDRYCKAVPFVFPKLKNLIKILQFKYVGTKAEKIKASGRMSMMGVSAKELLALQQELEGEYDEHEEDTTKGQTKKQN